MSTGRLNFGLLVSAVSLVMIAADLAQPLNRTKSKPQASDNRYCKFNKPEKNEKHTMCQYENPGNCIGGEIIWSGLNNEGRKSILDMHNMLRNKHAGGGEPPHPQADNMLKMVWSEELEKIAQMWAEQCRINVTEGVHDKIRNKLDGTYVGQNVEILGKLGEEIEVYDEYEYDDEEDDRELNAFIDETEDKFREGILKCLGNQTDCWYNEQPRFHDSDPDAIKHFKFHHSSGHYSEMIWAKAWEIGCGWALIKLKEEDQPGDGHLKYSSLLVCNYAPGGNYVGHAIFEIGDAATKCPSGFSEDDYYPNLCSADKEFLEKHANVTSHFMEYLREHESVDLCKDYMDEVAKEAKEAQEAQNEEDDDDWK